MSRRRNLLVATGTVTFAGIMFAVPYFLRKTTTHSYERDRLSGSARQRGMYQNATSIDAGPDPDWDKETNTWKGRRAKILHPSVLEQKADLVQDIMKIEANDILMLRKYNEKVDSERNSQK